MRPEKFYYNRLHKYFMENYGEYENDSEWFVNPAPNKWRCYIPEKGWTITFTCDENGKVTEEKKAVKMSTDELYEVVKGSTRGMDAAYEDYLIRLVGEEGFDILRIHKLLQACGSINGRNLYVLCEKGV